MSEKYSCITETPIPTDAKIVRKERLIKNTFIGGLVIIILIIKKNTTIAIIEKIEPKIIVPSPEVKAEAKKYGWYVFNAEVTYSRSYPKGAREGRPIFRTSYSRWTQANKFHNFAQEFAERIGL